MEAYTLRALERIIVVIIGGLSVYLGYRLFLHVPSQKDGEGKISFPGGISIIVNRVGPGVFFALFGAGVVALSLYHGIVYFLIFFCLHPSPPQPAIWLIFTMEISLPGKSRALNAGLMRCSTGGYGRGSPEIKSVPSRALYSSLRLWEK